MIRPLFRDGTSSKLGENGEGSRGQATDLDRADVGMKDDPDLRLRGRWRIRIVLVSPFLKLLFRIQVRCIQGSEVN